MVKASIARLGPRFSSSHMLSEYGRLLYRPAAEAGRRAAARSREPIRHLARFRERLERCWALSHVLRAERDRSGRRAEVDVFVPGISTGELQAEVVNGSGARPVAGRMVGNGVVRYSFPAPARGSARLRVWPRHPLLPHPRELGVSLETVV